MAVDKTIMPPSEATGYVQAAFDYMNGMLPFSAVMPMKSNDGEWTVEWTPYIAPKATNAMRRRALDAEAGHIKSEQTTASMYAGLLPLSGMGHISERDIAKHANDTAFIRDRAMEGFTQLGQEAAVTLELNRIDAFVNGKITLDGNGIDHVTYDFKRPAKQSNQSPATKWDTTSADVATDVQTWVDTMRKNGGRTPHAVLTSRKVIDALRTNDMIREATYNMAADKVPKNVSRQDVLNYLAVYAQLTDVRLVDEMYENLELDSGIKMNVDTSSLVSDKLFIMFPSFNDSTLGFTADGPTAEGADADYGLNKTVNQGMIGALISHEAPSNYDLWANGSAMPILVEPVSTFTATVLS